MMGDVIVSLDDGRPPETRDPRNCARGRPYIKDKGTRF